MRVCPVCHARAFDDAEVCYGCMHRFSGKEPAAALMPGGAHKGGAVGPLPQGGADARSGGEFRCECGFLGRRAAGGLDEGAARRSSCSGRCQATVFPESSSAWMGNPAGALPVVARNVSVSAEGVGHRGAHRAGRGLRRRMRLRRTMRLGRRPRPLLASCCAEVGRYRDRSAPARPMRSEEHRPGKGLSR